MMERDRLVRGFYAGILGSMAQDVWSIPNYALGWSTLRFIDWAAITIYGRGGPFSTAELLFSALAQLIFGGVLGIVFVYLIPVLKHHHFALKGLLMGWVVWFSLYGITLLFKVEPTLNLPLKTPVSNFIGASIYGLVLAWAVNKLSPDVKQ